MNLLAPVYNMGMGHFNYIESLNLSKLSKVKCGLLVLFPILVIIQFLTGFNELDDYLIIFLFILFLNDFYYKIKKPDQLFYTDGKIKRSIMSFIFAAILLIPFLLDILNVSNATRLIFYQFCFVLWAQVFLLDAFIHYKETKSKEWLVITNVAALLIVFGTFIV